MDNCKGQNPKPVVFGDSWGSALGASWYFIAACGQGLGVKACKSAKYPTYGPT